MTRIRLLIVMVACLFLGAAAVLYTKRSECNGTVMAVHRADGAWVYCLLPSLEEADDQKRIPKK